MLLANARDMLDQPELSRGCGGSGHGSRIPFWTWSIRRRWRSGWARRSGRAVIAAATLGSGMALLDGTVVNVALKSIGEDLDASLAQLQWITNGYLLSLACLILLGGSLGDRFGRRRIFVIGTIWFAAASLLCGIAPNAEVLIVARMLQGVGRALLTPGSLAMIEGVFVQEDRAPAIGAWSGLTGIAAAIGPFVGGGLVQFADWRWIFLINLPIAALTVLIAVRAVPESRDPNASVALRLRRGGARHRGAGGDTYALIEWGGAAAWAAVGWRSSPGSASWRWRCACGSRCWCSGCSATGPSAPRT